MRLLSPEKIIRIVEEHREELLSYSVKKIGLFGSYLHKTHKRGSDIDFLVQFHEPTYDNYIDLKFFLERLLHRKIDLVLEKSLKPQLSYVRREALYAKGV